MLIDLILHTPKHIQNGSDKLCTCFRLNSNTNAGIHLAILFNLVLSSYPPFGNNHYTNLTYRENVLWAFDSESSQLYTFVHIKHTSFLSAIRRDIFMQCHSFKYQFIFFPNDVGAQFLFCCSVYLRGKCLIIYRRGYH